MELRSLYISDPNPVKYEHVPGIQNNNLLQIFCFAERIGKLGGLWAVLLCPARGDVY